METVRTGDVYDQIMWADHLSAWASILEDQADRTHSGRLRGMALKLDAAAVECYDKAEAILTTSAAQTELTSPTEITE